jgi:hypothetical protein
LENWQGGCSSRGGSRRNTEFVRLVIAEHRGFSISGLSLLRKGACAVAAVRRFDNGAASSLLSSPAGEGLKRREKTASSSGARFGIDLRESRVLHVSCSPYSSDRTPRNRFIWGVPCDSPRRPRVRPEIARSTSGAGARTASAGAARRARIRALCSRSRGS